MSSLPAIGAPPGYRGRGFLYVLACGGPEDLCKVGLTHDPLQRWSALHPRWFEAFDLDHSLLLETETRADARALETALHRLLRGHNCPAPLTMRLAAGGGSEWFRNAYPALHRFCMERLAQGFVLHPSARAWLAPRMRTLQQELPTLLRQAWEDHHAGRLSAGGRQAIRDLVDAHRQFDAGLEARLPPEAGALLTR